MTNKLQLQKEYKIHVHETDVNSKLNLASLFNYLQDIASEHAEILGFGRADLMKYNQFWALSRMYAEISVWPEWKESIIVKTYTKGVDKLFALRNYEVSYPDGKHIAFATSSWLILDQTTRRIQRPETALIHFNRHPETQKSPLRYASKLELNESEVKNSDKFKVKISDLDINLHTNNVKYLQWISDSYDIDFVKENCIHSIEINYLSESFYNDEVYLQTRTDTDSYCNHSVIRSDGKELCRVRLGWKQL
jgi:acyl-ACP thioesterase